MAAREGSSLSQITRSLYYLDIFYIGKICNSFLACFEFAKQ